MRERVIDKTVHRVTEYASLQKFLDVKAVPAGISTIYEGGLPIDLLVSPAESDTTIFFFHGAIERHFTLPVLSGLGISGGLDANRVFISDPSLVLDERLMLAWYAGNHHQPHLQTALTSILTKVARSLGSKKVVFFGGSGGGFASLYFASQFDNSLALVFNPQTNIAKYSPSPVRDFAEKAFQVQADQDKPLKHLPHNVVVDVCKIYETRRATTVAYMQNHNDDAHLKSHLLPFSQAIHPETEFLVLQEPWQEGHTPPPKELLSRVLNLAITSVDWVQDFSDLGFLRPHMLRVPTGE